MRHSTITKKTISGKTEAIWKTISQIDNLHNWFSTAVESCGIEQIDGDLFRFCTMQDGSQLKEHILAVCDKTRQVTYSVCEHPLPSSAILTTLKLDNVDNKSTLVIWTAAFTAREENISTIEKMLQKTFLQGIKSLEDWHHKTKIRV